MMWIRLLESGGPARADETPDVDWLDEAQKLMKLLDAAPDQAARHAIIDANEAFWGRLREWLLKLSENKCWYSEARDIFSVLEVEHYRPKKRCKRVPRGHVLDGYWWLTFYWRNYRLCGKIGNAKKGDFFPLANGSPVAARNGPSYHNEIPMLLDPAKAGDVALLTFNEDGACSHHFDATAFEAKRVLETVTRLNLDYGRLRKARQRIWKRCRDLIQDCREVALQMGSVPGPADRERLDRNAEELSRMVRRDAEFSGVAKACLLKSDLSWVRRLATE
jgi:hypothetical protein